MADRTKIEWTNATWNPITGCSPLSPGCANCYAKRMAKRLAGRNGYPKDTPFAVTWHHDKLETPLGWCRPRRVFVCSMGDLFHEDIPDNWISHVFAVMAATPRHTYQILTKRPRRMLEYLTKRDRKFYIETAALVPREQRGEVTDKGMQIPDWPLPNVWLGTTTEDQARADERIPMLLQCPAALRFVSVEPMLGPVNLWAVNDGSWYDHEGATRYNALTGTSWWGNAGDHGLGGGPALSWVICGGETGPGARPMHPDWVRSLRDQCRKADVPFFFKQWAKYRGPGDFNYPLGNMVDGRKWEQFPEVRP